MTLTERWQTLWQELGARGTGHEIMHELMARYSEPHRAYHTLTHIEHCLRELDDVFPAFPDPRAPKLALWYHDVIYDPRRHDNESESIVLLWEHARCSGLPKDVVDTAASYIAVTTHGSPGRTVEERTIVDIDLGILGQCANVFDEYDRAIREEYHFVPWDAYASGRTKVLQSFLERPTIFSTTHFIARYEQQARTNLERAIVRLTGLKHT